MKRIIIALGVAAVLAAGVVTVLNMTGDGSVATASGTGPVVPRTDVEERAAKDFPYRGDAPDAVSCPSALPARKGALVRCTAIFGKESKTMEVSADKVDGDQVSLGFGLLESH
ncbi:DUF4333 domain-containing protein [Streptomyces sp. NPDC058000]|uniref:DUF4333 domain-containing protein n=1 Tax=Streptomyces sp. NPDC058000 TaxID=3346299 RepID=UPI0036EE74A3